MSVRDSGWTNKAKAFFRASAQLANKTQIQVGVPEDAGTYEDGTPVSVVAAAHEFGLGNTPQRSFIRGWFDSKSPHDRMQFVARMAHEIVAGNVTATIGFEIVGEQWVKELRARMDAMIDPALQDATIARKRSTGSATPEIPLEDTGRLRAAVTYKVVVNE